MPVVLCALNKLSTVSNPAPTGQPCECRTPANNIQPMHYQSQSQQSPQMSGTPALHDVWDTKIGTGRE